MHSPERSDDLTAPSAPRISFSGDFLNGQIIITKEPSKFPVARSSTTPDFEFLAAGDPRSTEKYSMLTADELFSEGRLLPFWRPECAETLSDINITVKQTGTVVLQGDLQEDQIKPKLGSGNCGNWFVDEDPSPRPPKCTVLWKELLRLKKQHSAAASADHEQGDKDGVLWKRKKKGLERTRSASLRIRPVLKMPICSTTHGARISNILPL